MELGTERNVSTEGTYTAGAGTIIQTSTSISEPGRTKTFANPVGVPYQYTLSGNTLTVSEVGFRRPLVFTRQSAP